ncbi:MAG: DUF1844 domain-containing protein [Myxococcota bacterium]
MSDETNQGDEAKVLGDGAGVYLPSGDAAADEQELSELSIDFGGFIVSLYQNAMMSLGKMDHIETGDAQIDLETARHMIDILRMLHIKTRNNLDTEEEKLIRGLLYELKVAFVEAKQPR